MNNLAIVIPAFKAHYFRRALESIYRQTNRNFNIYIGDDSSPDDLYAIVKEYEDKLPITYKRFENNLGGTDLVGHWHRCLDLITNEEWCWLFSDDDIMEPECVAQFYKSAAQHPNRRIFHLNVKIIDEEDAIVEDPGKYPELLNILDFHKMKWQSKISSYVVEYVFKVESFIEAGGFVNFNYAWHSDEATWSILGYPEGLFTVPNCNVQWRRSGVNITPNNSNLKVVLGKLDADLEFTKWVAMFYKQRSLSFSFPSKLLLMKRLVIQLSRFREILKPLQWKEIMKRHLSVLNIKYTYPLFVMYYYYASNNKKII